MDRYAVFALVVMLCAPCWIAVWFRSLRRHLLAFWITLLLVLLHMYLQAIIVALLYCAYVLGKRRSWQ